MMYRMKNIINHDDDITLPKCMYRIRNPNEVLRNPCEPLADDINIRNQVIKFLKHAPNKKMAELEQRQDQLLKKLDILYNRIKAISSHCGQTSPQPQVASTVKVTKTNISTPDEIVVALNPDNLPWFINLVLKETISVKLSWHIHSSVPNEKVSKINAFIKKLKTIDNNSNVHLRLIFKSGSSADSELKLSSLSVPIVGNVNILRYLASIYPNVLPYDSEDYYVDALLDMCHQLERVPEKGREAIINKIFSQQKEWIYKNNFSIVDVAVYNVAKQWQNSSKYVPKTWFEKCERKCL